MALSRTSLVLPIALAVLVALSASPAGGASETVVVTATVPSATHLAIDQPTALPNGCETETPGVTAFGITSPGVPHITAQDCNVQFGSSNDSSMLLLHQSDRFGSALVRAQWVAQTPPAAANFQGVSAVDGGTAWGAGTVGRVIRTTDGGTTWSNFTSAQTGVPAHLQGISASSASVAFAAGQQGWVTRTTNGGALWSSQDLGAEDFYDVAAADSTTAWVVGTNGTILHTTDGTTWVPQVSGTANQLYDIDVVDAETAWVVGAAGTVLRTIDGGDNWLPATNAAYGGAIVRSVTAVSATRAWMAGSLSTIYRTIDGGTNWTAQHSVLGINWEGLSAPTSDVVFAVTDNGGRTFKSVDGGATWDEQTLPATPNMFAIDAFDPSVAWAVGNNAIIATPDVVVADYDDDNVGSDANWTEGDDMFGVCLETATNGALAGAAVSGWEPAGNDSCTTASPDWNGVPITAGASGSKIAATAGPDEDAAVSLRFGFKPAADQEPGTYTAALAFTVVAPAL